MARPSPLSYPVPVTVSKPEYWDQIIESMRLVMHGRTGTGRGATVGMEYQMAGKTGTAQVFGIAQDAKYDKDTVAHELRDHALFVAFAPIQAPAIAVAVVAENGGSGSGVGAPIARKVMDAYLRGKKRDGQ